MNALSSLENFQRMMERRSPERLPLDIPAVEPVLRTLKARTGKDTMVDAFDTDFISIYPNYPCNPSLWKKAYNEILGLIIPDGAQIDFIGAVTITPPNVASSDAWHLAEFTYPLSHAQTLDQVKRLPWTDTAAPELYAGLTGRVREIHARGKVAVGHMACTLFEHAWYLRGMDTMFMDWADENPISDWLLDYFTQRSIDACREYVRAGVDIIFLGDDIGTQNGLLMSPDIWRKKLKWRLAKVVAAIREADDAVAHGREANAPPRRRTWIAYHSDGYITPLIGELREIGIDILNPLQPECMDVPAIIAEHKEHLAFWGMIGTQSTLPFGTSDEITRAVVQVAAWHAAGARVILAPTHCIEPDVPWENLIAFVDAAKDTRLPTIAINT